MGALMKTLSEQIAAAEVFARTARFHLDNPRPENLEQARHKLLEALGAKEVSSDGHAYSAPDAAYEPITTSSEAMESLQHMISVATTQAA